MAEHPILFNTEMVKAILDGRKTMTRRVMRPQPSEEWLPFSYGEVHKMVDGEPDPDKVIGWGPCNYDGDEAYKCPYGQPGDLLWVRETWCKGRDALVYRADHPEYKSAPSHDNKWRPSIHMPRWASRITLEVTSVRVERVRDISEDDAMAEGVTPSGVGADLNYLKYRAGFQTLWDTINAKRGYSWDNNPWVWVVEFKVI